MSGTLYVVATPIGNLEDVTLRALRILKVVDLIAAEDTRRTAKLLAHYGISTATLSFHTHNSRDRVPQLVARLRSGSSVALVSDAGTPSLSDPGIELVQACLEQGIRVDPIPGVSAPLTAAMVSGFPIVPLTILGFAPNRLKDRMAWLSNASEIADTFTFFEAPHRIASTLNLAGTYFGERPIMLGRELTKLHQELLWGTADELATRIESPRGEFTVVVGPRKTADEVSGSVDDEAIVREFCYSTDVIGSQRRDAIKWAAKKFGISARYVYGVIERHKNRPYGQ